MSNSVCRVCAPNCGDELPDVAVPLVEDADAPPADAVAPVALPWPWPSADSSDAIGSDCALLLAEESGCSSDCHKAEGLLAFEPLTENDMKHSCTRNARAEARPAAAMQNQGRGTIL